jgi:hypothetical protein
VHRQCHSITAKVIDEIVPTQVCGIRERYSNGRKHFQTCGLTCANKLKRAGVYVSRILQAPSFRILILVTAAPAQQ